MQKLDSIILDESERPWYSGKQMEVQKTKLTPVSERTSESLAEAVYESLLEGIVLGQLSPGTFLSAAKLSAQLEVSRTPIHDALWMLATDGLVEIQPGRRARVTQFGRDDLWEIFEMRKLLEGFAAELAAGRMDQRQLGPLRRMADALQNEGRDNWTRSWSDFDEAFHRMIADSSGNRRLAQDISRYHLLHRGFNRVSTDFESLQQALAEHLQILAALEARDGALARQAMEEHISHWQIYFTEKFHEP